MLGEEVMVSVEAQDSTKASFPSPPPFCPRACLSLFRPPDISFRPTSELRSNLKTLVALHNLTSERLRCSHGLLMGTFVSSQEAATAYPAHLCRAAQAAGWPLLLSLTGHVCHIESLFCRGHRGWPGRVPGPGFPSPICIAPGVGSASCLVPVGSPLPTPHCPQGGN